MKVIDRTYYGIDQISKYTQRNLFEILLTETEIRLYLPFSNWFGTAILVS